MRVLHVFKTFCPETTGGIEQVINQIAISTKRFGVQSSVFTLSKERGFCELDFNGIKIYRVGSLVEFASTPFSLSALFHFKRVIKSYDIVHFHFPYPFADILHLLFSQHKPSVVTYHSDIIQQKRLLKLYSPIMHRFLGTSDRVVATSPNYLSTSSVLKTIQHKTEVVPIGLDEDTYPKLHPRLVNFWREKLGSGFFLFVGVLRYYKGLHLLIEAAKSVKENIVIIGAGPVEESLKSQAKQEGLDNVVFLGFVSDASKVAIISLSRAMVFPSNMRSEAFGVSLLEGAMYSKPLISSEIGTGTTYVNDAGVTGFVVTPDSPNELAEAMNKLLDDPGAAESMGVSARRRFEKYFQAEDMGEAYFKIYTSLCNSYGESQEGYPKRDEGATECL